MQTLDLPAPVHLFAVRSQSSVVLDTLAAALIVGVLGNLLLRATPWGLNVLLWTLALLVAALAVARRHAIELHGEGRWMALPALGFAALLTWRASPTLSGLNLLALGFSLVLGIWRTRSGRLQLAGVVELAWGAASAAFAAFVEPARLLHREVDWHSTLPRIRSPQTVAAWRGLAIALPLLVVFGTLFTAADPVFERMVGRLFRWHPANVVSTVFWTGFWGWVAAGLLGRLLIAPESSAHTSRDHATLGVTETGIVLGLLNTLFAAFVLVQARSLLGGPLPAGVTPAEYARRGFFELFTVAAFLLPVLLVLHAAIRRDDAHQQRVFRALAGVLIALLFAVLASALRRMHWYQQAYGLTELRLYTTAFMGSLALVFLWLAATVLRQRRERFVWGALLAGYATLGILNGINPDALIVRINVARAAAGGSFDADYLGRLSADAVPVWLNALRALTPAHRCRSAWWLASRSREDSHNWRSWNHGRAREHELLLTRRGVLRAMSCVPLSRAHPARTAHAGRFETHSQCAPPGTAPPACPSRCVPGRPAPPGTHPRA